MKTSVINSKNGIAKVVSMGAIASIIGLATASAARPHASAAAGASGTTSMQYSIGQRANLQQTRIEQGIESGRLTAAETARIEKNETAIDSLRRSDRQSDDGGALTASQKQQLVQAQNRAASKIFQLKHNQDRAPGAKGAQGHNLRSELNVQQKYIAKGIASGKLNAKQVGELERHEANIESQMRSDRNADSGGRLTAAQRKQLIQDEKSTAKKIHELENKPTGGA